MINRNVLRGRIVGRVMDAAFSNIASPKAPSRNGASEDNAAKAVQSCASECTQAATQAATARPRGRSKGWRAA